MLLFALLLASPAHAAATCKPLDEPGLRALVFDAQSAIDRGDRAMNTQIVDEVLARVPCLQFVPSPRQWSDFLVELAITRFAENADWQTPLGAALRLRPGIDRGVAPGHPMALWEPPPVDLAMGGPLPPGDPVYVDGTLATTLPPAYGLYLVQRVHGEAVASRVVVNEELPTEWLTQRLRTPHSLVVDTLLAGTGTFGVGQQVPDAPSGYVPSTPWVSVPVPGAVLRITGTFGAASATGEVSDSLRGTILGSVVARADLGAVAPGLGVGAATVTAVEGDLTVRGFSDIVVPWAFAAVDRRERTWEAGVRLGGYPGLVRTELRGGVVRAGRVWCGGVVSGWWAELEQTGVDGPSTTRETGLSVAIELGAAGGRR